jgi:hypothetical protein
MALLGKIRCQTAMGLAHTALKETRRWPSLTLPRLRSQQLARRKLWDELKLIAYRECYTLVPRLLVHQFTETDDRDESSKVYKTHQTSKSDELPR